MEEVLEHPLMQLMIVVLCRAGDLEAILRGDLQALSFFASDLVGTRGTRRQRDGDISVDAKPLLVGARALAPGLPVPRGTRTQIDRHSS